MNKTNRVLIAVIAIQKSSFHPMALFAPQLNCGANATMEKTFLENYMGLFIIVEEE